MFDSSPLDARQEPRIDVQTRVLTSEAVSTEIVLAALWRQKFLVLAGVALALALGMTYLWLVPYRYIATAQLVMDTRRGDPSTTQYPVVDPSAVESQVETLRSQRIAIAVIEKFQLARDSEFIRRGLGTRALSAIGLGDTDRPLTDEERLRKTILAFRNHLTVTRIGPSYVANVAFLSLDPTKAARIANEVVDAYIDDQLNARVLNVERSNSWIQKRTVELRQQAERAAFALETFRAKSIGGVQDQGYQESLKELTEAVQDSSRSYDTFQSLVRYAQSSGERNFPVTDARILAQASPPLDPSSPDRTLIIAAALAGGLMLGGAAAFLRERLDNRIRSTDELERKLGLRSLAFLPFVGTSGAAQSRVMRKGDDSNETLIRFASPEPSLSAVSDLLIGVQLAVDSVDKANVHSNVIGVTSARARDGKTTVAYNLALSIVDSGKSVLLVDCNLRNAMLTRTLTPDCQRGLGDPANGLTSLETATVHHDSGFDLLPMQPWGGRPANTLRSAMLRNSLQQASEQYDYVIVDLPSALDHVDVEACAGLFGGILLVVDLGRSTTDDLRQTLAKGEVGNRVLGVVVTRTWGNRRTRTRRNQGPATSGAVARVSTGS